jgi:hypothetical protein
VKTRITLKSFNDLPPEAVPITDSSSPPVRESSSQPGDPTGEDFRAMLRRRYTTPFVSAIPYQRWGINK